jgi:hypothetical protein
MKAKSILMVFLILTISIIFYTLSRSRVESYRTDYTYRLHAAASPMPSIAIEALAGEFKGMVANYLLLEAASYIGSHHSADANPYDWEAVSILLDRSSYLDPYFRQTYRLAQSTLPWHAHKYDETLKILERSRKHLPWDWQPGFFLGFNYYYFLKDNLTASKILMETSRVPNAPVTLATLASRLSSKAGQISAAIAFLSGIYKNTDDQETRELLETRIKALRGAQTIQSAVGAFQARFNRPPHTLDELVENDILLAIPQNPYNRPYTLKNGQVDF